ncbi:MAG: SIS domain-containing protein [Bacteroidota bacterium]
MREPGYYTKPEIQSQPEVWRKSAARLLSIPSSSLPQIQDYQHIVVTGCGSTYYQSLWAAVEIERACGIPARAVPAGELLLSPEAFLHSGHRTLLMAISRSAETTETVRALELFKTGGYGDDVVITCHPERPLGQMASSCISVPDAQEQSVAQTRSFSSMMLGVARLISDDHREYLADSLYQTGSSILANMTAIVTHLGRDLEIQRFVFLGSGPHYGLACEAMLKMKEMALAESQAFHFLEFRHGPISVLDGRSLVIALMGSSGHDTKLRVLRDVRRTGARTLVLSEQGIAGIRDNADDSLCLDLPESSPWFAPCYLPPLQMLALERALSNGLEPDSPRHLGAVVREI